MYDHYQNTEFHATDAIDTDTVIDMMFDAGLDESLLPGDEQDIIDIVTEGIDHRKIREINMMLQELIEESVKDWTEMTMDDAFAEIYEDDDVNEDVA